jgi:hypothetical protein
MALESIIGFSQGAGVGQGYFSAIDPLTTNALIEVGLNAGSGPVQLVVTRFGGLPPVRIDIPAGTEYAIHIANIQTIGILNISDALATGTISIDIGA